MPDYIASYQHVEGRVGVLVQLRCRDGFSPRTTEFKALANDIAIQVAAMRPACIAPNDLDPSEWEKEVVRLRPSLSGLGVAERQELLRTAREQYEKSFCLLKQPFCKDDSKTVGQFLDEVSQQLGDSISVVRFIRYDGTEA